jgi:hypothetical protein
MSTIAVEKPAVPFVCAAGFWSLNQKLFDLATFVDQGR